MDDYKLVNIERKIDEISREIGEINITLAQNTVILDEHQRRSTNLETRMQPIEDHIKGLKGVINFLKVVGIIAALLESLRALHLL